MVIGVHGIHGHRVYQNVEMERRNDIANAMNQNRCLEEKIAWDKESKQFHVGLVFVSLVRSFLHQKIS